MNRIILVVIGILISALTQAASFDCSKRKSNIEELICTDADLSHLDEALGDQYTQALLHSEIRLQVINSQKDWLKNVRDICQTFECVKNVYETRINQLSLVSNSALNTRPVDIVSVDDNCPDNLGAPLKYDIYHGVQTYVQDRSLGFGINSKAIKLPDWYSEIQIARLCDGKIAVISLSFLPGMREADSLYARIYDDQFRPITEDFRVAISSRRQSDLSVAPMKNGGFVVTWRTDAGHKDSKFDTNIHARIFDISGKPLSKIINVSLAQGMNINARAYGLPNGGFVVVWVSNGILLRFYDAKGSPKTEEIEMLFTGGHEQSSPHGYVTFDGSFNLFLPIDSNYIESPLYYSAQSFNMNGRPQSDILNVEELPVLAGYQMMVNQFIHNKAMSIGMVLPEFRERDKIGTPVCGLPAQNDGWVDKLRKFTIDTEVIKLASRIDSSSDSCKTNTKH